MDSNAAGAELVSVKGQVVAFGTHFPRCGFQFFYVFVDDAGEGCWALTHCLSGSLHLKRGKPVIHRNFHWDLSMRLSASASCRRSWPAMRAAPSVPLICCLALTATMRSPGFAPAASASFLTFSGPMSFSTVEVMPSGATFTK